MNVTRVDIDKKTGAYVSIPTGHQYTYVKGDAYGKKMAELSAKNKASKTSNLPSVVAGTSYPVMM